MDEVFKLEEREVKEGIKLLFEYAPDAIYLIGRDGVFIDGNKAAELLIGYRKEDIIGKHILESGLLPKEQAPKALRGLSRHMNGEETCPVELVLRRKDGLLVEVELRSYAIKFGGKSYVMGIARDITDRKRAERALKRERDMAQNYLNIAADMIMAIGRDQKVALINKRGCAVLGYDEDEIVGKNWFDNFMPADERSKVKEVFSKLMIGELEPVEHFENKILTKSGEERVIEWRNSLLKDTEGQIIGSLSSGRDVTERKKGEEMSKKAYQKLKMLHVMKDDFINSASHALKTPLTSITSFVNLLYGEKLGDVNPKQKESLDIIRSECRRLERLADHILDSSRIEGGDFSLNKRDMDFSKMVKRAVKSLIPAAREKGDELEVEAQDMIRVKADPFWMEKVLDNLIGNAIKFTDYGDIKVRLEGDKTRVKVSVEDTGRGVAKEHLSRIFEKFYQAEKQTAIGTGLGLYVSKRLVETHGGEIGGESRGLGKGSTFWFTLPRD